MKRKKKQFLTWYRKLAKKKGRKVFDTNIIKGTTSSQTKSINLFFPKENMSLNFYGVGATIVRACSAENTDPAPTFPTNA